jgi:hypothetical protein
VWAGSLRSSGVPSDEHLDRVAVEGLAAAGGEQRADRRGEDSEIPGFGAVGFLTAKAFILCVSWISQNFIQLGLLPALMVCQYLQSDAADARAAKTLEDVEDARECIRRALDLVDCLARWPD